MYDKKQATKVIKHIMGMEKEIKLCVAYCVASWGPIKKELSNLQWKRIGYVSALAEAFEIDRIEPSK